MIAPTTEATPDEALPTFDVLPLSQNVRQAVNELGYVNPTPVQCAVFEPATRGRDLVVQARTGTGKTAAFGLPIINSLIRPDEAHVQTLILCPTRELALQVTRELTEIAKHSSIRVTAVYGGAPMGRQVQDLQEGAQIVVGTPGRVLDHLGRGTLDPADIRSFVLDESDEMLSMGFLPQITDILSYLPDSRQTLLFSATLPPVIQRMAETRLKNPEFVTLSGDHIGALEIDHYTYMIFGDKVGDFLRIVEVEDPESAVVFCNTRDETKRVAGALSDAGYSASWLNADLPQSDREKVMAKTREGNLRFLVATDVAARGIDISHLTHVINYDMPLSAEGYVHRTGRTGRAGRTGTAISLIAPSDVGHLYYLRLTYKVRPIQKALPSSQQHKTRLEADILAAFAEIPALPEDIALARRLLTHDDAERIIAGLLRSHLGASPGAAEEASSARRGKLPEPVPEPEPVVKPEERPQRAAEPEVRYPAPPAPSVEAQPGAEPPTNNGQPSPEPRRRRRREREDGSAERPRPEPSQGPATEAKNDWQSHRSDPNLAEVFLNVGSRDGASQDLILDTLHAKAGLAPETADYVNVRHRHSFVGIQRKDLEKVIEALNGAMIGGKEAMAEEARPRS